MASRSAFLELARRRFKQAEDADQHQRDRELSDLRFYAGEQWDDDLLKSRKGQTLGSGSTLQIIPARPSLTINKTREPVRQVLNQERQSDMGIELIPADDFGEMAGPIDHTEIQLREGLVRRIQRDSEASDARSWAFSRAVIAGRGYWRIRTRFVPGKTWDQELYVERLYNQASVLLDPAHEQPDGSDAEWGFVGVDLPWADYVGEFGERNGKKNKLITAARSEWRTLGDEAPGWFTGEWSDNKDTRAVRVVDYYYTTRTVRKLALLTDRTVQWVDELPEDFPKDQIEDERRVVTKTIKWAKIDGSDDDVLEETEWPGHYIPIIKVLGEELQPYDAERRAEGIVFPMRDACKGNNYVISKFVERVGLTPIPPIMMAIGQDEGLEDEYNAANTRTLGRLHYNQVDSFNRPAPPPFRVDSRAEIADIGMGVQIFGQAITATSLVPETALGNVDPSVKSGKLAKALIDQAERGTSNFLDNLMRSMRHEGRIINDLLFPIYGRPGRLARMMNPQGEMESVLIGQPFITQGQGKQAKPVPAPPGQLGAKTFTLTENAEFNVAVKVSKSEATRREQEASMLGEIIGADPQLMQVMGDLFFKYQDGPGHEEMAERMKAVLLPAVQATLQGQAPGNPEDQQKIAMLTEQLQQATELADKNKTDLMKTQMQQQAEGQRAQLESQRDLQIEEMKNATAIRIAEINAAVKGYQTEAQHAAQHEQQALNLSADEAARSAEAHEAETQRAHEQQMAAQEHQQALKQGEQAGQQASDQMVQQAALQPPEAGA